MADVDVLERFVRRLNGMFGADAAVEHVAPRVPDDGAVVRIVYRDVPMPGFVTGFSYGLSLVCAGRELTMTMRTTDVRWAAVPAAIVAALRGMCPCDAGQVLGYRKPYVEGSSLTSAVLAAPAPAALREPVDGIRLVGVYPLYATEREEIRRAGFDRFWSREWDRFDPARPAIA